MAVEMRTTVCEIFLSGWRSSQILKDTEVRATAHISQDSDSERPTQVISKSRKHRIHTHFPRDRNCEVCLRIRIGEALPRAEKFGDLITADHKVSSQ